MANPSADIFELEGASTQIQNQLRVMLAQDSGLQQVFVSPLLRQLGHAVNVTDRTMISMPMPDYVSAWQGHL
jgi:hypothetical protein